MGRAQAVQNVQENSNKQDNAVYEFRLHSVAYWQIEIRCSHHADCDLIMQTQNDISLAAKRLAERWNWENAVDEHGYITRE